MLNTPLPLISDPEGNHIPEDYPCVIDSHVHLFPDAFFHSIWKWFETYGWPIRYKLESEKIISFLQERGIRHIVAMAYAHKPGVAELLNDYMLGIQQKHAGVTALATVFPGEPDADKILLKAFEKGLAGVKLHAHVQCFDMNGKPLYEICRVCEEAGKPLLIHAGKEPKSPAYPCDPYKICSPEKTRQLLKDFPDLKLIVPHLGADDFDEYAEMIEEFDNLWLDTAMAIAEYLPAAAPDLAKMRFDRILFGTDFPNIPYAWDRELLRLSGMGISSKAQDAILCGNAKKLFSLSETSFPGKSNA